MRRNIRDYSFKVNKRYSYKECLKDFLCSLQTSISSSEAVLSPTELKISIKLIGESAEDINQQWLSISTTISWLPCDFLLNDSD